MKYWVYINNEIKGPFEPEELVKIEGFSQNTLICPQSSVEEETKEWKEAREMPEVAVLISNTLSSDSDLSSEPKQLQSVEKKDEIIIERFGIENLFTPVPDAEDIQPSTDPLTLSQIRKRTDISTQSQQLQQDSFKEVPINQNTNEPKSDFDDIEIPSTDELLKEIKQTIPEIPEVNIPEFSEGQANRNIETGLDKINTQQIDTQNSTQDTTKLENLTNIDISQIVDDKIQNKIFDIKKQIIEEVQKLLNEKIVQVEDNIKSNLSTQSTSQIDFEKVKSEILSVIEAKISNINLSQQIIDSPSNENFKKEFEELKTLVSHLEIEIRDLRNKTESIEDKTKIEPATLNREKTIQQQFTKQASVVIDEPPPKKLSILKLIFSFLLIIIAVGSVFFALKQFGIFDLTSILGSKNKPQMAPMNAAEMNLNQQGNNFSTTTVYSASMDSTTIVEQSSQTSQPPAQIQEIKQIVKSDLIPPETVINEVKDYKINSPYNLEKTISMILKSRKADLSSVKWEVEQKENDKFYIVITAKGPKPTEFKFEFEPKTKILQPLNTISVNVLKMMVGESDNKNKKSKIITKNNKKKVSNIQNKQTNKNISPKTKDEKTVEKKESSQEELNSDGQVLTDAQTDDSNLNQNTGATDDEYLIIGE
ncbi:MAG: hypothetical protein N2Z20_00695 [Elusimicrobiales bacterium]|nr:hypothetical protein [Elusimicrobiales bacterium]